MLRVLPDPEPVYGNRGQQRAENTSDLRDLREQKPLLRGFESSTGIHTHRSVVNRPLTCENSRSKWSGCSDDYPVRPFQTTRGFRTTTGVHTDRSMIPGKPVPGLCMCQAAWVLGYVATGPGIDLPEESAVGVGEAVLDSWCRPRGSARIRCHGPGAGRTATGTLESPPAPRTAGVRRPDGGCVWNRISATHGLAIWALETRNRGSANVLYRLR